MREQTAILYFSRSPEEEIKRKKLHGNVHTSLKIARYLDQRTLSVISSTDLHSFIFRSEDQKGETPGQKLNHCIEQLFDKGYQQLIIVGNDCPELKQEDLLDAEKKLETADLVIGPDMKGGTFLIGLHKKSYRPESLELARWGTTLFLSDLIYGYRHQKIDYLSSLSDFYAHFSFRNTFRRRNLIRAIFDLFMVKKCVPTIRNNYIPLAEGTAISRGPPIL